MINREELINTLILSRIGFYNATGTLELYKHVGDATTIIKQATNIRNILPNASPQLVERFKNTQDLRRWAEDELRWAENYHITPLCFHDDDYPQRLTECPDAPLILFYKGTANLNQQRIISIVGTRKCTLYGQDLIRNFIKDLRQLCPDILIISGLAYGVDIHAHRQALENNLETVAVLAHGLDQVYPGLHRETAKQMVNHGGLITEYASHTNADKQNFVRRNRIVAGMCDACILVESAAHGGGLITAGLSKDYNRDVFAFPGAIGAVYSEGCNHLIRDNNAALICNATDFLKAMNWDDHLEKTNARKKGIERQLFPELSAEEQLIVDQLILQNDQQVNILTVHCNIPIAKLSALIFSLEMKGVVKPMAGGSIHLLT